MPIYTAWQMSAAIDLNLDILGLKGFRKLASQMSTDPLVAIASILTQLEVPRTLWKEFLISQVLAMPGWFAWARYHSDSQSPDDPQPNDFISLMAIRLVYDLGVSIASGMKPHWDRYNVLLPPSTKLVRPRS